MKRLFLTGLMMLAAFSVVTAQQSENTPKVKLSGFVKTDVIYDSRQVSAANGIREGHFYLFPDSALYDADSNDVNDNPAFHILNIQTRLRADISGPDVLGAKSTAAIEGEFFGTSESDLNGFRLRHAFIQLAWPKWVLMAGQNWHPMFPAESFPGTLSFNTGAPFTPFSRNPQLRLTRIMGNTNVIISAYSQRDFTSTGPDGGSNKYLRNSGIPGLDLQIKQGLGSNAFIAAGADYKTLRPALKTPANFATSETIAAYAAYLKFKVKSKAVTVSMIGVYAQNATDLVMLGGYAVKEVTDSARKTCTYTNLNTLSAFVDIATNGTVFRGGLFAGYSRNLGADDNIGGAVYARGANIDHLMRLSPRFTLQNQHLTLGAELEMTTAAYGTAKANGSVENTKDITNYRLLLSAIYKF
ncbi:MAG TPA: hypothetical protein P5531_05440 [Bacteroidales bacterium]|nr:hypothetical protein [Bacteroidales bacterium]HSA42850.1 hypothetical protein [Bacteroidales bacterium]